MKSHTIVRFDPRGGQRTLRTELAAATLGRGAAMTRQPKWTVARAAAVVCTLVMAALALALLIFSRAFG